MGALSFALFFIVHVYLLPSLNAHDIGKVATIVADQLNNLIDVIGISKEIHAGDNGEIEFEFLDGSLNPLVVTKPIIDSTRDPTKLNVDFQAKVKSKNFPLNPIRGGISTNVQLANQAKWSPGAPSSESQASKEFSSEEEWVKSSARRFRDATTEESRKNATYHLYIPDIKDILKEKFAKASMQLGLDVDVTSKKNVDGNVGKIDVSVVDNRTKGKKNYIRLCKRLSDGSASLMQKLRGKDCVKLPRSEFYLEPNARDAIRRKDDTVKLVGLKIGTKTGNGRDYKDLESASNENKQRRGMMDAVETSISDLSANHDESGVKMMDKFGTGLNIKMPVIDGRIANLLHDGKLSLSASTALKV